MRRKNKHAKKYQAKDEPRLGGKKPKIEESKPNLHRQWAEELSWCEDALKND